MNTVSLLKGLGYLVSTFSVLLLGTVAWKSAAEHPFLLTCLLLGMITSITGMGLRWLSHRTEQKQKKQLEAAALRGRGPAAANQQAGAIDPMQSDRRPLWKTSDR